MPRRLIVAALIVVLLPLGHAWATHADTSSSAIAGPARVALELLPTRDAQDVSDYSRSEFGRAWSDDVDTALGHDGCDQRNGVLALRLQHLQIKPGTNGCVVLSGDLPVEPYTGQTGLRYQRGQTPPVVSVDHVVALAAAAGTGARQLDAQQRRNLAGDPLNLLVVSAQSNSSKADRDASRWLPAHDPCGFVARQIAVKARYRLWVTPGERSAMNRVLDACPAQELPTQ